MINKKKHKQDVKYSNINIARLKRLSEYFEKMSKHRWEVNLTKMDVDFDWHDAQLKTIWLLITNYCPSPFEACEVLLGGRSYILPQCWLRMKKESI